MAIYKGNKEIVGLYKGPTEIIKRYKGSNLIYNVFKWLPYSYEHIYNSLVPSVINNKNVKEKAQVVKVYGNSEVKNQLIVNSGIHQSYQSWTIDNSQGSSILYATQRWDCPNDFRLTIGHKYLIWFVGTKTIVGSGLTRLYLNVANQQGSVFNFQTQNANIITINSIEAPNNVVNLNTIIGANTTLTVNGYLCFADLTQWFPFNTPTALTDPRVQEIINRGHIPYNAGTLKNVDMGEIDSEPYNLFDGSLEMGTLDGSNGSEIPATNRCRTKYIPLIPNRTYRLEMYNAGSDKTLWVVDEYDTDKNFIRGNVLVSQGFTTSPNSGYLRFAVKKVDNSNCQPSDFDNAQLCLFLQGTRTGYAPHTQPYILPFKYQGAGVGTSHDTLEDGGTEWIFTKAMVDVDLGAQNFVQKDNGSWHFRAVEHSHNYNYTDLTNIVCPIGEQKSAFTLEQKTQTELEAYGTFLYGYGGSYNGFRIFRSDLVNKTVEEVQTAMAGIILKYELATPQVVRIPKKHLAAVDLGTLNWTYNSGCFYVALNGIKKASSYDAIPNLYCSKYLTASKRQIDNGSPDKIIGTSDNIEYIYIIDSDYTDATTFKQAMSGIYLFYETEDEVADIPFDINIEASGSVTTNWFSWVENQLVNYSYGRTVTTNGITITNNNDGSFTISGTATAYSDIWLVLDSTQKMYSSHKYLLFSGIVGSNTIDSRFGIRSDAHSTSNMDIGYGAIGSRSADTTRVIVLFTCDNGVSINQTVKPCLIDLTLAFGAGNEPTSIDDPRIQYIIEQGYIPTNTTGTTKSIASGVLPNIDFKIKCR